MSDYQLTLTIESADERTPQVRVWIDDQPAGDLSSEQEIKLVRESDASWCARFSSRGDAFIYRVGIYAAPNSRWSLSLRAAGDDGEEFLFDSDELAMTKEWLVGTCELTQRDSSPANSHTAGASGAPL
jgi:hypothetical protein